jgi:hypothetical protein
MTVDVIAWPPFQLTGWELADVFKQSKSVGLIEGRSRTSSAQRGRRVATANVAGIGTDLDGAGYVRMLNMEWEGKPNLTRLPCLQSLWHLSRAGQDLASTILSWTDNGTDMLWTEGSTDMLWVNYYGDPATDAGYNALTVSGLPASQIIARPSELISVSDGTTTETAYVLITTKSNADGVATIRTNKASAFTLSGLVSIGHSENVVFEASSVPRSVQGVGDAFGYQWDLTEVFADEYPGGFVELNPWIKS